MAELKRVMVEADVLSEYSDAALVLVKGTIGNAHVHAKLDIVHPFDSVLIAKYAVGDEVLAPDGLRYQVRARIVEYQIEPDGRDSMWIEEELLSPIPAKTALDKAREAIESRLEFDDDGQTEVTVRAADLRRVLDGLAELEKSRDRNGDT